MRKGHPEAFQRKIVIDAIVLQEARKVVVDFGEYVKLKQQQTLCKYSCEMLISFLKKGV